MFCTPEYAEDCHYPLAGGPVLAQPAWDDSGAFTLAEITFDIDVQIDGSYGYNISRSVPDNQRPKPPFGLVLTMSELAS